MSDRYAVFVESNTTGTGGLFAEAATALGYRTALLARETGRYRPWLDRYDEVATLDTGNPAEVAGWCRSVGPERVAGITSSSEYFVVVAARAAEELGLPHPSAEAVLRCRNKELSRRVLSTAGVAVPGWRLCTTVQQARAAAERRGGPVVVKPVDGSGSVGVRLCADPAECAGAAAELLAGGVNERGMPRIAGVLVEDFVDGPEVSVEVWNGRALVVVRKHLGSPPWFVEVGHDVEANLPDQLDAAVRGTAERAVAALGIGWGPVHVELRLAADGPYVIEVNPRLAGGNIPRLVQLATGIDLIGQHLAQVVGEAVAPPVPAHRRAASIRFLLFDRAGRFRRVPAAPTGSDPRTVEVVARPRAGDHYRPRGDFTDRVGHVLSCAESPAVAVRVADAELRRLTAQFEWENS
ncbi:ATP-grasp domain-containing protein [Plantactinospora sp. DSM 117369]